MKPVTLYKCETCGALFSFDNVEHEHICADARRQLDEQAAEEKRLWEQAKAEAIEIVNANATSVKTILGISEQLAKIYLKDILQPISVKAPNCSLWHRALHEEVLDYVKSLK